MVLKPPADTYKYIKNRQNSIYNIYKNKPTRY